MLTGLPPFYCRDREKLFEKIRTAELTFPKFVSAPARCVRARVVVVCLCGVFWGYG